MRNVIPGLTDLSTLVNGSGVGIGISEHDHSIYKQKEKAEEDKVFQINESVRTLLSDLESNNKTLTEQQDEDKTQ